MSAPDDPPSDPNADAPPAGRGRRLRARRAAPPLRLIEQGEGGSASSTTARLNLTGDGPITLMRLGRTDLTAGISAVRAGARPTAVVTALSESRDTTVRARRLSGEAGVPWLSDPSLFRAGLDGYRTAPNLQALDYTPGRDGDPYRPDEFQDDDLVRRVGRSVIGAQVDLLCGGAISGAFAVSRIDDPWLAVNQALLRIGADAATAWDVPLIAALPLRMAGFDDLEQQRLLVRALAARRPAAWLLMLDGLSEDRGSERTVAALRLALLLQAASAPVILARAGDLRRLAWALGIAGAEFGLGRLLRFSVPDFRKAKRGPGPTPGPRMELASMAMSVPSGQARQLLGRELVAEADCDCGGCSGAESLEARIAAIPEHDAHTVVAEAADLAGQSPAERCDALDRALQEAANRSTWLADDGVTVDLRTRIQRQRRVLHAAAEAGLLEPARLAAELRLFD